MSVLGMPIVMLVMIKEQYRVRMLKYFTCIVSRMENTVENNRKILVAINN